MIGFITALAWVYFQQSFENRPMSLFSADSLCDPPCEEEEYCDEIKGRCICDPSLREEEICRKRQGKNADLMKMVT